MRARTHIHAAVWQQKLESTNAIHADSSHACENTLMPGNTMFMSVLTSKYLDLHTTEKRTRKHRKWKTEKGKNNNDENGLSVIYIDCSETVNRILYNWQKIYHE